jgi:hypothetical protein
MPFPADHHKRELAAEVLAAGGAITMQASGASMLPSIWPGDALVIENKSAGEIAAGNIVLIARDGRFFVHRLIGKKNDLWITRGDSMPQNDPPAAAHELLGRVSAIHRGERVLYPREASLMDRVCAWIVCRCDTLRNLALRMHAASRNRARIGFDSSKTAPHFE